MAESDFMVGYCPHCRKKLQIPAELEQFACMYCGEKMKKGALLETLPQREESVDVEKEYAFVKAHILRCISDFPESLKHMNKQEFTSYSDDYMMACRPTFEHLDMCAKAQPGRQQYWGELAAGELMAQLEDWFRQQKGWNRKAKQTLIVDSTKYTITLFLVPMLSRFPSLTAKPFAKKLNAMWLERYPKSPWSLATYEELQDGFRKRRLCFITTAVCEAEGLPDDCDQLQTFRAFRDGWLARQPDGRELIEEYYNIAPAIVTRINYCDNAARRYAQIRTKYLQPCYQDLQAGRMQRCKRRYVKMVRVLEKQYLTH